MNLYDHADIEMAAHDLLLSRSHRLTGKAHPGAEILQDLGVDLVDICAALCRSRGIDFDEHQKRSAITPAISSGHFSDLLATWGATLATAQIDQTARDVRRLTTPIELPDYRPVPYPILSMSKLPELTTRDDPSIEMVNVTATGEDVQLGRKTFKLMFSRELVENDDRSAIEAAFLGYAAQVGRRMGRDFAAILETNANLSDGVALFAAGAGNDVTSAEISVAAIDAMAAALRDRTTPDGELYNARPKYLLVPSGKEAAAKTLVRGMTEASDPVDRIEVVCSPWLSGTYYYLIADPQEAPSLVLGTLQGSNGQPLTTIASASPRATFENLPNGLRESFDGAAVDVRVAYGMAAVERNAIRNTTA